MMPPFGAKPSQIAGRLLAAGLSLLLSVAALPAQAGKNAAFLLPAHPAHRLSVSWQTPEVSERVRKRVEKLLSYSSTPIDVEIVVGTDRSGSRSTAAAGHAVDETIDLSITRTDDKLRIQVAGQGRGLLFGVYAALEKLGYRFWNPLEAYIPPSVSLPPNQHLRESPTYAARGFTHHTMHPLELAHVLNGWGPGGAQDAAGWQGLLPEWESYLEWLIANRQNEIEWVLLEKAPWAEFARSPERQARLRQLTGIGHDWQVRIGIDAPLALEQQNGWRLIPQTGEPAAENAQLLANLDWLADIGLDFVSTELGTSEFTHGGAKGIVDWLNAATDHLAKRGLPFFSKIHISSGQHTPDYKDPQTGEPLNINFLPYYADPRLGVMPHSVQIYALDDPAPTYGHTDFSEMHRFMRMTSGKHPMLWFPETAYWVNYDIHVPLFLPVYARQRVHDLRLLKREGLKLEGQMLFSSGWENGYWLNDVLTARSSWNPGTEIADDRQYLEGLLQEQLAPYGPAAGELTELLLDTMDVQHKLLVLGQTGNQPGPKDVTLRTGIAYLAGQDTWSQLAGVIRGFGLSGYQTQPDRLEFETLRQDPSALKLYRAEIAPLLAAMNVQLGQLADRAQALAPKVPPYLAGWYAELRNGLSFDRLRAELVYQLMEATADQALGQDASAKARLRDALGILTQAEALAAAQTKLYSANPERIAGWGAPNPTAYRYGYLWPARSLYFWKRDWLQVATNNYHPCLLNIIDPLEIALPDPGRDGRAQAARALLPALGLADCFAIHQPDLSLDRLKSLL